MEKIPKIIHYCWVGGNPKPQSVLYCIESWKKFCPDYEIREWNETNYDFTKNEYMHQAYEAKKWGFVPDYARLDIIYEHGGIYLDTDVEMVRSFDELLEQEGFMGFENTGNGEFFVNCGHGFGAVPHNEVVRQARALYDHLSFLKEDGTPNLLASPYFTTQSLRQFGLKQENSDQKLDHMMVYASDVLCPKNFSTGKIHRTSRTVSIHHFTASWVDEKIKKEAAHQKKIRKVFGNRLGGYVLVGESVLEKYSPVELVTKVPGKAAKKLKGKLIQLNDARPYYRGLSIAKRTPDRNGPIVLLDTSAESDNQGDYIIVENCEKQLSDCMDLSHISHIPTHRAINAAERAVLMNAGKKIFCGTNALSGHMSSYGLWHLTPDVAPFKNTVLMGVGFDSRKPDFDRYSSQFFQTVLCKTGYHSVRDSFSAEKLRSMGIKNVLYTGCPTMWGLTAEKCATIPTKKASRVICTITDYLRDPANDSAMLDILLENYDEVYLWLQGRDDLAYIRELGYENKLHLVESTLSTYDKALRMDDLDYVGTRLHAGIRALSAGRRSLIISIDNRAACIGADTGLPIIPRADITASLKQRLYGEIKTSITMPWDNIALWKSQFTSDK